jgi:drug/metabolite transporter (DMT)-like permease
MAPKADKSINTKISSKLNYDNKKSSARFLTDRWRGGLWKVFGCACFALVNGMIRSLTGGVPNSHIAPVSFYEIVFLENFFGALILLPWLFGKGIRSLGTRMPLLHTIRVIFAVVGMILWYASLKHMQITQAIALSFMGTILGVIGARLFLKEYLTPMRLCVVVLSFMGGVMITRPDLAIYGHDSMSKHLGIAVLLPILSAIAFAGTKLCSRRLAERGESARLMTFYLLVFMAPVSFIPAAFVWVDLNLDQLMWILIMGILSTFAYLAFARSYKLAEISFLAPFGFSKLLLSAVVGYLAFGEIPQSTSVWLGIVVILISLLLLSIEKKSNRLKILST